MMRNHIKLVFLLDFSLQPKHLSSYKKCYVLRR
jgi:hypothetical protein